ncbi:hypothetical protein JCM6882_005924 [Rhodosporidiobolus microsporus]
MPKAPRANSKKAAPSTSASALASAAEQPLFQVDTTGSSSVRHALLADQAPAAARLRKGQSFKKPLRSDLILAQRSAEPALSSRVVPSAEAKAKQVKKKLAGVDRRTKEKLRRIVGKDGEGEGLWGVKSAKGEGARGLQGEKGKAYDAWAEEEQDGEDVDAGMKKALLVNNPQTRPAPKAPSTLHTHQLLASTSSLHPSVSLPHPGSSYNPSHEAHQSLLSSALVHHTAAEARETRGEDVKAAMDSARVLSRGVEAWEAYEDEVGSGESDGELEIVDEDVAAKKEALKRKAARRKTKQQRNNKLKVAEEERVARLRREFRARANGVQNVKDVKAALAAEEQLSLEEKALALKARKARLASQGLTRFRSGPSRVPDAPVTFQLGDELADNLRTLQPEGNLWTEWVGSGMRRGRVPVERANSGKKGGKRGGRGHDKGHKMKEVEKFAWKRFE